MGTWKNLLANWQGRPGDAHGSPATPGTALSCQPGDFPSSLDSKFAFLDNDVELELLAHWAPHLSACTDMEEFRELWTNSCNIIYVLLRSQTLRLAFRLSDGICRVTLYSVCRSSSSEIKLASCTKRFARTICSLNRRRLLTNTASLVVVDRGGKGSLM